MCTKIWGNFSDSDEREACLQQWSSEDREKLSISASQHLIQLGIIRVGNSAAPQTQEADTPGLDPSSLAQQYFQVILMTSLA